MSSLAEKLYAASPATIQDLGVTLYGLKVYRREYGAKFKRLLEEFERQQWFSSNELKTYQSLHLAKLVQHAYENVPFYREVMDQRNLTPRDIQSVDDLRKMPIVTKDVIKANFQKFLAKNRSPSTFIHGRTSGTTGSPLELIYDSNVCLVKNVVDWRQKSIGGIKVGDRHIFVQGRMVVPVDRKKPPFWRKNWILNHLYFSSFHLSSENLPYYLEALVRFKPKSIEGYPSTLNYLARSILAAGIDITLKAAFMSSEMLLPEQRSTIEAAFHCRVYDFYGMAERAVFATECDLHNGKHLNDDFGITEVLAKNGEPAKAGELGRIVVTGLHNYAMPLIRYQSSDVTALNPEACACGRAFPLMHNVTSKDEDVVTTKDGRYISPSLLTHPFKPLTSIQESQVIQESVDLLRVLVVRLPSYTENDTRYLVKELQLRMGAGTKIEIEFVDQIPRTANGKFRWVVSKVPVKL
ncbi:MAG: hypothetical protein WBP29_05945 [Candidatus Zixiibacteriota bacterium]